MYIKKLYRTSSLISGILFILGLFLFLPVNLFVREVLTDQFLLAWYVVTTAILCGISLWSAGTSKKLMYITFSDLCFLGYVLYILVNALAVRPYPVPLSFWLKGMLVILIYFSIRLMEDRQKEVLLIGVVIAGLTEAFLIFLQKGGWIESRHLLFNCSGSFLNPGLAGGFLSCVACILAYGGIKALDRRVKIISGIGVVLVICALLLTDSRAGGVSVFIGFWGVLWNRKHQKIISIFSRIRRNIFQSGILLLLLTGTILFIYQHKKASADGRLFIWQNSMIMVKDKPFFGHGVEMFRSRYPFYQAYYFEQNPDSSRDRVAGNPAVPFNEYVGVLVGQGIFGFLLCLLTMLSFFLSRSYFPEQQMQKAFLLSWGVFAFFSYPTVDARLLMLLPLFLSLLPGKGFCISRKYILITGSLLVVSGIQLGMRAEKEYQNLQNHIRKHEPVTASQYQKLKYDLSLLQKYTVFMDRYLDFLPDLILSKIIWNYISLPTDFVSWEEYTGTERRMRKQKDVLF